MGTGAMATLTLNKDFQLTGRRCKTTPPYSHRAHRQIRHHMHAVQGIKAFHRPRISHPHRPLGQLFGGLKQQPHSSP